MSKNGSVDKGGYERGMRTIENSRSQNSTTEVSGSSNAGQALPLRLLSPAGGPEQLDMALHFGADEVYLAGKRWGMRARSKNFSREQLAEAVRKAHQKGVSVHLTLNTIMTDADLDELSPYLQFIDEISVDAAIVADLGTMALVRRYAPHVELHVSTQASVMNATAAQEYVRLGARRIVLARELTLKQIAELHRRLPDDVELETFAHGSMCMAISGRCLLSSGLVGLERGANAGACTQPCRWNWTLVEEEKPDTRRLTIEQDDRFSYILSSNDLCMLEHLDDLAEAGVTAVKLEGRAKGAFYTALITNAYRHVIDGEPAADWMGELEMTSHRPFSTGFFYGNPTQNPGNVDYVREARMVGTVVRCVPAQTGYLVEFLCRNKAHEGDVVQAVCAGQPVRDLKIEGLEHWDALAGWEHTDTLSRAMERYRLRSPFPLEPLDILRIVK